MKVNHLEWSHQKHQIYYLYFSSSLFYCCYGLVLVTGLIHSSTIIKTLVDQLLDMVQFMRLPMMLSIVYCLIKKQGRVVILVGHLPAMM